MKYYLESLAAHAWPLLLNHTCDPTQYTQQNHSTFLAISSILVMPLEIGKFLAETNAPIKVCPTCIPGVDVRESRGLCHQNLPQGVGTWSGMSQSTQMTYTFSFIMLNFLS